MCKTLNIKLTEVTDLLIHETPSLNNNGLLNGKLGISLYFFHLAKKTNSSIYYDFAGTLIDGIYNEVQENHSPPDFANGLAGIAWGIEYLAQNKFVDAHTDLILSDVDDKIYLYLTNNENIPIGIENGILGYISYILARLAGKKINDKSTAVEIFQRLLIDLINRLSTTIENGKLAISEPRLFDITWELPLCLYLLSQCRKINIHTNKIDKILDHLSPIILSLYPYLQSHRLYLLLSMEYITRQMERPQWNNHADLLKEGLNGNHIIYNELNNKNINLRTGATGIFLLHHQYIRLTKDQSIFLPSNSLENKILTSEYWNLLLEISNTSDRKYDLSFLNGISGICMMLLKSYNQ